MSETQKHAQLQMVYRKRYLGNPPVSKLPDGYRLRSYLQGDERRFYEVMELSGWSGWDDEKLAPWIVRILPRCWFMVIHEASDQIVATAMGLHSYTDEHPFGGELGWVASDSAHRGKRLGLAVSAAVTARLIEAGYDNIHLYTEHWRLAAIKTYFNLGYVPFLYLPEMQERWRIVCEQLSLPFAPDRWGY